MTMKSILAAMAAVAALSAAPAFAHGPDRGPGYTHAAPYAAPAAYHRDRWAPIIVRAEGRELVVRRGDRLYERLSSRPFRFEPGRIYTYTNRCSLDGCTVLVSNLRGERLGRVVAPVPRALQVALNDRDHRW